MAHGGTLTINPQTGLPEAGFLDSILPTLIGGAATFFSGGTITPLMAAMGVGGLTALTSKDLGKGLMAGLGAYGGGEIVSGLAGFGTGALSAEAGGAAINAAGVDPLSFEADQIAQNAIAPKIANASYSDKFGAGLSKAMSNPGDALSAFGGGSKLIGAAKLSAPLFSALSTQEATPAPTFQQIQFDPRPANISIDREQLAYQPDTGSSAQRGYFGPTRIRQYGADGGFVADGGIERFAGGGIPLDPTYDYSGYGRKKSTAPVQVVQPRDVPKPDFVGADGKTYRYDPVKKSWYVFKDAPAKTNPGVEVLMGDSGPGGGQDAGGTRPDGSYNMGYGANPFTGSPQAAANSPLGAAVGRISNAISGTQPAAPVEDKTGVPTQAAVDYGKSTFGKTGDPDQDIGPVAGDPDVVGGTYSPAVVDYSPGTFNSASRDSASAETGGIAALTSAPTPAPTEAVATPVASQTLADAQALAREASFTDYNPLSESAISAALAALNAPAPAPAPGPAPRPAPPPRPAAS
jgi:hypothetical protein